MKAVHSDFEAIQEQIEAEYNVGNQARVVLGRANSISLKSEKSSIQDQLQSVLLERKRRIEDEKNSLDQTGIRSCQLDI